MPRRLRVLLYATLEVEWWEQTKISKINCANKLRRSEVLTAGGLVGCVLTAAVILSFNGIGQFKGIGKQIIVEMRCQI